MTKFAQLAALLFAAVAASAAIAQDVDPNDDLDPVDFEVPVEGATNTPSCLALLCMAGVSENGGIAEGCEGAVASYFNIVRTRTVVVSTRNGPIQQEVFDGEATQTARLEFLTSCPSDSDNDDILRNISASYGAVDNDPAPRIGDGDEEIQP